MTEEIKKPAGIKKASTRPPDKPPKLRHLFKKSIVRVSVSMDEEIWKRLKIIAIWENRTLESVIGEALADLALRAEKQRSAEGKVTEKVVKKPKRKVKKKK